MQKRCGFSRNLLVDTDKTFWKSSQQKNLERSIVKASTLKCMCFKRNFSVDALTILLSTYFGNIDFLEVFSLSTERFRENPHLFCIAKTLQKYCFRTEKYDILCQQHTWDLSWNLTEPHGTFTEPRYSIRKFIQNNDFNTKFNMPLCSK